MKNKLEIVARLLQEKQITVDEATVLLENQHYHQPIFDWTYRPGPVYCNTTSGTSTNTTLKVSNATVNTTPESALFGGC